MAHHEAGHVLALVTLGYSFRKATVRTMRESLANATRGDDGRWWYWRGGVDAPDILPPDLTPERLAACNQLQPLSGWQAKAKDHAVVTLAGPVAQARYSKVRLATLLGQSAEHGDRAAADAVLSTWFGEDTPTAFDHALCRARALVNTAEGWAAIQDVAVRLLDAGEITKDPISE